VPTAQLLAGAARGAAGRPGQGRGEGADDGRVAQKGQPGSAEGAGEPRDGQAAPQPGAA